MMDKELSPKEVIKKIVSQSAISEAKFYDENNHQDYTVRVRNYVLYVLRNHYNMTYKSIALAMGRDNTSCLTRGIENLKKNPLLVREAEYVWKRILEKKNVDRRILYFNLIHFVASRFNISYEEAFSNKEVMVICSFCFSKFFKISFIHQKGLLGKTAFSIKQDYYAMTKETRDKAYQLYKEFKDYVRENPLRSGFDVRVPNYKTNKIDVIERDFT